jgi:hypothetical protein
MPHAYSLDPHRIYSRHRIAGIERNLLATVVTVFGTVILVLLRYAGHPIEGGDEDTLDENNPQSVAFKEPIKE